MIRLHKIPRRQVQFAYAFAGNGGCGTQAAMVSGYGGGPPGACVTASRLLRSNIIVTLVADRLRQFTADERSRVLCRLDGDNRRDPTIVRKLELLLVREAPALDLHWDADVAVVAVDDHRLDELDAIARFATAAGVGATKPKSSGSVRKPGTKPQLNEIDPFS